MEKANNWIELLNLKSHPEGGHFKEMYRSPEEIPNSALPKRFSGDRCFSTSIYFLLKGKEFSAFHRIKQDEIWHFYDGSSLTIHVINPMGQYSTLKLGREINQGETFQTIVTEGCWFAASVNQQESFSLVGCTVAPGFDFEDFEMADPVLLKREYPEHDKIIEKFTLKP